MFCMKCGTQLPDGAKFCISCGAKNEYQPQQEVTPLKMAAPSLGSNLVAAKCTNCGGALQVDPGLKTAECPFCKYTYVVEQAINNYNISVTGNLHIANATINVQGRDINTLLARGKEYEEAKNYKVALEYYNKILDIDNNCEEARRAVERVTKLLDNQIYLQSQGCYTTVIPGIGCWHTNGILFIKKDVLGFVSRNNKTKAYAIKAISDLCKKKVDGNWHIVFKYPGKHGLQRFEPYDVSVDVWIDTIQNAQRGRYPER